MIYTSQWLNTTGDVTLGWTEDQAAMMTEVIAQKMKEGYTFFIKDAEDREIRLKTIADLRGRNAVSIGDREAERLIREGRIGIVEMTSLAVEKTDSEATTATPTRRATSASEAARSHTVAAKPHRGG